MKKWFANSAILPFGALETIFDKNDDPNSKLRIYTAENATATKENVMNTLDDMFGELRKEL